MRTLLQRRSSGLHFKTLAATMTGSTSASVDPSYDPSYDAERRRIEIAARYLRRTYIFLENKFAGTKVSELDSTERRINAASTARYSGFTGDMCASSEHKIAMALSNVTQASNVPVPISVVDPTERRIMAAALARGSARSSYKYASSENTTAPKERPSEAPVRLLETQQQGLDELDELIAKLEYDSEDVVSREGLLDLAQLNKFPQDDRIVLEQTSHRYFVDKAPSIISASRLAETPFPMFNPQYMAQRVAGRNKYTNMTAREVAHKWEGISNDARKLGQLVHHVIDVYLKTKRWPLNAGPIENDMTTVRQFFETEIENRGLEIFRSETLVFAEVNNNTKTVAGTIDAIFTDRTTGDFHLMDWKRSKKIKMDGSPRMKNRYRDSHGILEPFTDVVNDNFHKYSLQLHIYRHILQKGYNMSIPKTNLSIVSFPPGEPYKIMTAADLSDSVEKMFENIQIYVDANRKMDEQKSFYREWLANRETALQPSINYGGR